MSYPSDPLFRAGVVELLGGIWKKLPAGIVAADRLGASWFSGSTPFVHSDRGQIVAHVGVIEIPLWLGGRAVKAAGIHAVCTHPHHRGRGHLRQTMQRALAWIDDDRRYDLTVLWANDPEIYTQFGFVRCPESVFHGPLAVDTMNATGRGRGELRRLSLDREDHVAELSRRLARRVPVSPRCGTVEPGWLALIDLCLWPEPRPELALCADLDCLIVFARRGRTVHLYDVIADAMPTLSALVAATDLAADGAADAVVVYFSPESLAAPQLVPGPTPLGDFLMARGPNSGYGPGTQAGTPLTPLLPLGFSPLMRC